MALTKNFSIERPDWGTVLKTPLTRGLILNNQQVELVRVTKLTGDTAATVALTDVQRPLKVFVLPVADSAGAAITAKPTIVEAVFTKPDQTNIALTSLGNWTQAYLFVTGRSYKTS